MKLSVLCIALCVVFGTSLTGCSSKRGLSNPLKPKSQISVKPTKQVELQPMSFVTALSQDNSYAVAKPTGEQAIQIQKALDNTNKLRAEKGLPPLKYDASLAAYAQLRAGELAVAFSHNRPDGQSYATQVIGLVGENIAGGYATADETVLKQWRESVGHYQNMTNSRYTSIGIGMVYVPNSRYKYYWVQIFGIGNATTPYYFSDNGDQAQSTNTRPLDTLIVNGRAITLPANPAGTWHTISSGQYGGQVNGYQYSRFGVVRLASESDSKVFYQGMQTPIDAIPKGRATYQGVAVVVQDNRMNTDATAEFVVDFATHSLNGAIKDKGNTLFNLSGNIQGNAFVSRANASTEMQGAFFGEMGQELAGVFKDKTSNSKGAFGAVKK